MERGSKRGMAPEGEGHRARDRGKALSPLGQGDGRGGDGLAPDSRISDAQGPQQPLAGVLDQELLARQSPTREVQSPVFPVPAVLVPGWRDSGPEHWQSRWQRRWPGLGRVNFGDWHTPEPAAWTEALRQAVLACPRPPLLIAHSLGCLATANLVAHPAAPAIAGAMLVAPPDPSRADTPEELVGFAPPARPRFPVPGLVVISSSDAFADEAYGLALAADWGLEAVRVGDCGHINDLSGHGDWPEGVALLAGLLGRLGGKEPERSQGLL